MESPETTTITPLARAQATCLTPHGVYGRSADLQSCVSAKNAMIDDEPAKKKNTTYHILVEKKPKHTTSVHPGAPSNSNSTLDRFEYARSGSPGKTITYAKLEMTEKMSEKPDKAKIIIYALLHMGDKMSETRDNAQSIAYALVHMVEKISDEPEIITKARVFIHRRLRISSRSLTR